MQRVRKYLFTTGAAAAGLALTAGTALASASGVASPKFGTWGFDRSGMDPSVRPGDDFFKFANGGWMARTEIPSDQKHYGTFIQLRDLSEARVHGILDEAAAGTLSDRDAGKIGAAYASYMDDARVEQLDATPIAPALAEVRAVKSKAEFTALMGKANASAFNSVLPLYVSIDPKHPTKYAVMAATGGLGLPDRDYYLQASFAEKKAKYQAYVEQMLTQIGWEAPKASAQAIVEFETRLAEVSWTRIEKRDRDKMYNPMSVAELDAYTPGIEWSRYLAATGLPPTDRLIVTTNTAFPKVAAIYNDTPLETLKAWQAFHVVDGAAPYLSKRFDQARFAFRDKELGGQPEQRARWKRAATFVEGAIGESVGRVYVARYFGPDSKARMDELVANVTTALRARLERLEWMGDETKARALEKLGKFTVKIGYPEAWRDYAGLEFKRDDLYGNQLRATAWDWKRRASRLHQPVDKKEWHMTPQTVNAYYSFANNEIVFPAAILQAPFFDPDADAAINYGAIGGVIGHEISHGFDDQGRKSDGDGVLRDWWTPEDAARFQAQADVLGAQYSAFEPLPGAKVQGGLTMGENIGDMGGLSLALDAYRTSLKGKAATVIEGFSGDQRVFLGWAQVWRMKMRDEALRQYVITDPHSPPYYRVNGTIRNIPGWYEAWSVKPGDALYVAPEARVRIW